MRFINPQQSQQTPYPIAHYLFITLRQHTHARSLPADGTTRDTENDKSNSKSITWYIFGLVHIRTNKDSCVCNMPILYQSHDSKIYARSRMNSCRSSLIRPSSDDYVNPGKLNTPSELLTSMNKYGSFNEGDQTH